MYRSQSFGRMKDKDKAESELLQSVRKAISSEENAPKQKHVRFATVFTHEWREAKSFFIAIKNQPLLSDEIQCFKALITIHKVMRDGHPSVLEEAMREVPMFDTMYRNVYQSHRGYLSLIQSYVLFLKSKLEFHTLHPEFGANLDYEEYRALRKVEDLNEGFNTISELLTLLEKLDSLQKDIFNNFRPNTTNECRISALVPLVEESYGIYKFVTSMMTALHAKVESIDALEPLRVRYKTQYAILVKFYFECSNLKYLTSLISVPTLPSAPPEFVGSNVQVVIAPPPREKTPPVEEDLWGSVNSLNSDRNNQMVVANNSNLFEVRTTEQTIHMQQQNLEELQYLRNQMVQARTLLNGYEGRMRELEYLVVEYEKKIHSYELALKSKSSFELDLEQKEFERNQLLKSLEDQVAFWKNKYENIAKMYAQLRKEHLEALAKIKDFQRIGESSKNILLENESLMKQLRDKSKQLDESLALNNNLTIEFDSFKQVSNGRISLLESENLDSKTRFERLTLSQGAETKKLLDQFTLEHEQKLKAYQLEKEKLMSEISALKHALENQKSLLKEKQEQMDSLQTRLNQSLEALNQIQTSNSANEAGLLGKLDNLSLEHKSQMDKIMDSVLEDARQKLAEGIFELDNGVGNQNVSPEYLLSIVEKGSNISSDFSSNFLKYYMSRGEEHISGTALAESLRSTNSLSQIMYSILLCAKGLSDKSQEEVGDEMLLTVRRSVERCSSFFKGLMSNVLVAIEYTERPKKIQSCASEFQATLNDVMKVVENLKKSNLSTTDNLGDLVESELSSVTEAIEEAARMIQKLLELEPDNVKFSSYEIQVHQSILAAAKAVTDAISRLIICASKSQSEIVSNGKGSGSVTSFYKKNSRWMEGMISAARAVATATRILVESADRVVHGKEKMEQLMVASREVSSATAQLVAASRVKAVKSSKTQENLEVAAKAVTEATKMLVNAADMARKKAQENDTFDYKNLSLHDFKKKEMEQQVQILTLEKNLSDARSKLSSMRKAGYHQESDY